MLNKQRIFAQLLAKEDIAIVQDSQAKTAMFNIQTRVLTFPKYKNMSEINYTGFSVHEVGHALYTTFEVSELAMKYSMAVVGILEDLRIDNKMRNKHSGIKHIYREHYELLDSRNFFGDYSKDSNLLDKINLASKLRINLFDDDQQEFWTLFSNITEIDQLEEACVYVVAYFKNKFEEENKQEEETPEQEEEENSDEENSDEDSSDSLPNLSDEESEHLFQEESEEGEESDEETAPSTSEEGEDAGEDDTDGAEGTDEESEEVEATIPVEEKTEDDTDASEEGEEDVSEVSVPTDEESDEDASEDDTDGAEGNSDEESDDTEEGENSDGLSSDDTEESESNDTESDTTEQGEGTEDDTDAPEESEEDSDSGEGTNNSEEESESHGEVNEEESEEESDFDVNDITSETNDAFEESCIEDATNRYTYARDYMLPRTKDIETNYIPHTDFEVVVTFDQVKNSVLGQQWDKFNKGKKKTVNRMVASFNRNKSADAYRRRKTSDSGSLNMAKLSQYRTSDDLFLRNTKVAEGQNHGVVFYLDTSMSMEGNVDYDRNGIYTIEQVAVMTSFCRKLQIPYSVLTYTDFVNEDFTNDKNADSNNLASKEIAGEILHHSMNNKDHENRMFGLFALFAGKNIMRYEYKGHSKIFDTVYTPLHSNMLASVSYLEEFKVKNNVQVLNTMFFTDGYDTEGFHYGDGSSEKYLHSVVDVQNRKSYDINDYKNTANPTAIMIANMVRERVGGNVFFFYLPDGDSRFQLADQLRVQRKDYKTFWKGFKETGFHKHDTEESNVEYYILNSGKNDMSSVDLQNVQIGDKVLTKDMNKLREAMKESTMRIKGATLFADLIATKIAQGFK